MQPRYPIYIPSKGRFKTPLTIRALERDGVDFRVVVEPFEADDYASVIRRERLLLLPFQNLGLGSIPARNWIKDHAKKNGITRHWCIDDNINGVLRWYKKKRIPCDFGLALSIIEDFVDRYENVAIAGLDYAAFCGHGCEPPFHLNHRVYSCMLIDSFMPFNWRGRYNEDTDLCLQVLSAGLCTMLFNAFYIQKVATMKMRGGNTESLYAGDGRLRMARELERMWPGVVITSRRFGRPQHWVNWSLFDNKLKLKPEINRSDFPDINEYGMELKMVRPVKSRQLRRLLANEKETIG